MVLHIVGPTATEDTVDKGRQIVSSTADLPYTLSLAGIS